MVAKRRAVSVSQLRVFRTAGILLVLVALPLFVLSCSKTDSNPAGPSTPTATPEQQTHARINEYRTSKGLPALVWSDVIAAQARQHSQNMASGATAFGHEGFNDRVAVIRQTIAWSGAAENVAMAPSVDSAVQGWLNSPGHRANIEGNYDLTGIGSANGSAGMVYFTQIFVKSR